MEHLCTPQFEPCRPAHPELVAFTTAVAAGDVTGTMDIV